VVNTDRRRRRGAKGGRTPAIQRQTEAPDVESPVCDTSDLRDAVAKRFGVNKAAISRDVAWVEGTGLAYSGLSPLKCSFRRGAVSIEWRNPMPPLSVLIRAAGGLRALRAAAKRDNQ
jgi:hypothetical protein